MKLWSSPTPMHFVAAFCFVCALSFSHIGQGSLQGDAIRYAAIADNILQTGDWFNLYDPTSQADYYNKPYVQFWVLALFLKLFSFSTFTAKASAVIFSVLAAMVLWSTARILWGYKEGYLALILFCCTRVYFRDLDDLSMDGIAIFAASLFFHQCCVCLTEPARAKSLYWTVGVAAGLFLLCQSKFPYLLLITFPVIMLTTKDASLLRSFLRPRTLTLCTLSLGIGLVLYFVRDVPAISMAADNQFLEPFRTEYSFWKRQALWPIMFISSYFPASLIGIWALYRRLKRDSGQSSAALTAFWAWWFFPALFVMVLVGPRSKYLLVPMLPLFLLAARELSRLFGTLKAETLRKVLLACSLLLVVLFQLVQIPAHRQNAVVTQLQSLEFPLPHTVLICAGANDKRRVRRETLRLQSLIQLSFSEQVRVYTPEEILALELPEHAELVANDACKAALLKASPNILD